MRSVAHVVLVGIAVGFLGGCAAPPLDYPVRAVPAPADAYIPDLQVGESLAVLIPPESTAGQEYLGLAESALDKFSNGAAGYSNLRLLSSGAEYEAVLDQLEKQGSRLHDQDQAVKFGELLNAQYVISVSLNDAQASSTRKAKDGKVRWNTTATVDVNFGIVDVEKGKFVMRQSFDGDDSGFDSSKPDDGGKNQLLGSAVEEAVEKAVEEAAPFFPLYGTITEIRGDGDWFLVTLPSDKKVEEDTLFSAIHTQKLPSGELKTTEVGVLRVDRSNIGEAWCVAEEGAQNLYDGMRVRSKGVHVGWFSSATRWMDDL